MVVERFQRCRFQDQVRRKNFQDFGYSLQVPLREPNHIVVQKRCSIREHNLQHILHATRATLHRHLLFTFFDDIWIVHYSSCTFQIIKCLIHPLLLFRIIFFDSIFVDSKIFVSTKEHQVG